MVIDRLLTINPSCHLVRECSLNLCYCFLILCRVNIFVAWYLFLEQYSTLSVLSVYLYILVILANWGVSLRIHVFWIFHWHRSNTPHSAGLLAGLWRSLFRFLTLVIFSALWTCPTTPWARLIQVTLTWETCLPYPRHQPTYLMQLPRRGKYVSHKLLF